ncbi:MAG: metallophosphoesterase [Alphaproteobacteria bacterium]
MYDVIGDVHGKGKELDRLLIHLGYPLKDGEFRAHPEGRMIIFAADFIDRGSENGPVIKRARNLVERGIAASVMGNHEYNAVLWATPDPRKPGEFKRAHTEKNRKQHEKFLKEVEADPAFYKETIEWFKTLPLFLVKENYRFVHACWHQQSIDLLQRHDCITADGRLTDKGWDIAGDKSSPLCAAIDMLISGPEDELGNGLSYLDWEGHSRDLARVAWWKESVATLGEAFASMPDNVPFLTLPYNQEDAQPAVKEIRSGLRALPPEVKIFIGHIWEKGDPKPLTDRVACVDYGSGKDGGLVAYRTVLGETELKAKNFFWAPRP